MSKLDNLLAKPKKYTIDGVEIELKPLTIQHIDTIMKIEKPATQAEGMKEIVIKTLESLFQTYSICQYQDFGFWLK